MTLVELYWAFTDGKKVERLRNHKRRILDFALDLIITEDFEVTCQYIDQLEGHISSFDAKYQNTFFLRKLPYDLGQIVG